MNNPSQKCECGCELEPHEKICKHCQSESPATPKLSDFEISSVKCPDCHLSLRSIRHEPELPSCPNCGLTIKEIFNRTKPPVDRVSDEKTADGKVLEGEVTHRCNGWHICDKIDFGEPFDPKPSDSNLSNSIELPKAPDEDQHMLNDQPKSTEDWEWKIKSEFERAGLDVTNDETGAQLLSILVGDIRTLLQKERERCLAIFEENVITGRMIKHQILKDNQ